MKLLLWTQEDPASLRLAGALVAMGRFQKSVRADAYRIDDEFDAHLVRVDGPLLTADFANEPVEKFVGVPASRVLFLSKHSAASGTPAFTVHAIGNLGAKAEFGGKPRTLSPPDPGFMTSLLLALSKEGKELGLSATFEATHHGPVMQVPSLFVEVGSRAEDWENPAFIAGAARAVVDGYLRPRSVLRAPAALELGGGHYHPRQTDRARREQTPVGHLVPTYALEDLDPATLVSAVELTGAEKCLADARAERAPGFERARAAVERAAVEVEVLG